MFRMSLDRAVRYIFNLVPGTNLYAILLFVRKASLINLQPHCPRPVPFSRLAKQETGQQCQNQTDSTDAANASRKLTKSCGSPLNKVVN